MTPMPWVELTSEVARLAHGVLVVLIICLALGVVYVIARPTLLFLSLWRYEKRSAKRAKKMAKSLTQLDAAMAQRRQRLADGFCVECGTLPHIEGQPWCGPHYQKFGARGAD